MTESASKKKRKAQCYLRTDSNLSATGEGVLAEEEGRKEAEVWEGEVCLMMRGVDVPRVNELVMCVCVCVCVCVCMCVCMNVCKYMYVNDCM